MVYPNGMRIPLACAPGRRLGWGPTRAPHGYRAGGEGEAWLPGMPRCGLHHSSVPHFTQQIPETSKTSLGEVNLESRSFSSWSNTRSATTHDSGSPSLPRDVPCPILSTRRCNTGCSVLLAWGRAGWLISSFHFCH